MNPDPKLVAHIGQFLTPPKEQAVLGNPDATVAVEASQTPVTLLEQVKASIRANRAATAPEGSGEDAPECMST